MLEATCVKVNSDASTSSAEVFLFRADGLQPVSPVVTRSDPKQEGTICLSSRSSFLPLGVVAEPVSIVGATNQSSDRPFKFSFTSPPTPFRQDSLVKGLALQTQTRESYLDLSQRIVETISRDLNRGARNFGPPNRDSETTKTVARLVENFIDKNFAPKQFNFMAASVNPCFNTSAAQRFTPEFYTGILPLDLMKIAGERISKGYHCIGRTKKSNMQDRCKRITGYSKASLDRLFSELSLMMKPWKFGEVVRILLAIVKLVYCGTNHAGNAERDLRKVYENFMQDEATAYRDDELESFEHWLTQLELKARGETVSGDAPVLSNDAPSESASTLTHCGTTGSVRVNGPATSCGMFTFDEKCDLVTLGFEDIARSTLSSGPHTLQRYCKNWDISTAQIESNLRKCIREKIAEKNLKMEGSIYIFRHSQGIGFHKIGYSSHVGSRLKQWAESCKYVVDERADLLDHHINRTASHPRRLEKLIHTELSTKRFKIVDCDCKTTHQEWFQVDASYAQKIIAKWTLWMQKKPYDENGNFKAGIEIPSLGVEKYDYLDNRERRKSQAAQEQAQGRRKSGRYSHDASPPETPAVSTHNMTLRSDVSSRKRASA